MDRLPTDRRSIVCYLAILEALTNLVSYQSVVEQEAFASNPLTVGILTSGSRSTAGISTAGDKVESTNSPIFLDN